MMRFGRARLRPHIAAFGALTVHPTATFGVGPVPTHVVVERGGAVSIGAGTTIDFGCGLASEHSVTIGRNVTIGPYVQLLDTGFHNPASHHERPRPRPVEVGDGAVIGAWAMILPGATVEPGAIIPAGAIVTASRRG